MDIGGKFAKHRDRLALYGGLLFFALLGAFLIFIAHDVIQNSVGREMMRDFGIAFLSAAVLGLTIHGWLETTVIRDVVRAAIGHVLPPELRDEVRWITSFTCIVQRCVCTLDIEDMGNGVVKLTEELDTEIKNISTKTQKVRRLFTKDDWGIPGKSSQILQYEYSIGAGPKTSFEGDAKPFPDRSIQVNMEEASLGKDEIIRTFAKGVEYKLTNDRFQEVWIYPVVRPELYLRSISPTLKCFPEFDNELIPYAIDNGRRHILPGTLMPHQKMGVRWFPQEDKTLPNN